MRQVRRLDLSGAVATSTQFIDTLAIDIEPNYRDAGSRKRHGTRQTDVSKPDDCNFAIQRLESSCPFLVLFLCTRNAVTAIGPATDRKARRFRGQFDRL